MSDSVDRRDFFKAAALTSLGVGLRPDRLAALPPIPPLDAQEPTLFRAPPIETVRVGFVGLGNMGMNHVEIFLRLEGVEIVAVCDINPEKTARVQRMCREAGKPEPRAYTRGHEDYRRMCGEEELDLVYTATPWEWHAPICIEAMEMGSHAATEIPMAVTIDECWAMVETAERTRRHCVMMENCCYDRTELMILNMVRQNLFGELVHAECGYLHDLRRLKLTDYYEERWRVEHSITRNGDLYPTHGIGPVAQWLNVNRGNQFDFLVSMASNGRGLNLWAAEHIGVDSPEAHRNYALGDVVNTLLRTVSGQTILITHDTNLPRPYTRRILLQGTRGIVRKYPDERIHIEGRSQPHRWEELQEYRETYEHPLWRTLGERARVGWHGGMDFLENYRLIHCLRNGLPMDMDVYDGAAWSAISELSERSIAERGRSMDVPDFTRGAWRRRPPLGIITADQTAESTP